MRSTFFHLKIYEALFLTGFSITKSWQVLHERLTKVTIW